MKEQYKKELAELRKTSRLFLASVEDVCFRAVDCNQNEVHKYAKQLAKLSNYRGYIPLS